VQGKLPTGAQQGMDVDDSDMPRLTTNDNSQISIQQQTTPIKSNDTYKKNEAGVTVRLPNGAVDIDAYKAYKEGRVLKRLLSDEQHPICNDTKKQQQTPSSPDQVRDVEDGEI